MRFVHATILLGVLAGSSLRGQTASPEEEFGRARLQAGKELYQEGQYRTAAQQLRIAAFGFLAKPTALSECLARLALAQKAAGDPVDADLTLNRFLSVETRFPAYEHANLEPEIRSAFQALLFSRVPQASILAVPSLAGLIETDDQKLAKLPPAERRKAYEAAAKREPGSARWPIGLAKDALDRGDAKDAERWAGKALAIDSRNPEALELRVRARTVRGDCGGALRDLDALSSAELAKRPDLYADRFVCSVETQNWALAQESVADVPPRLLDRSDVLRAREKLVAEQQSWNRGTPPAAGSAKPAARPSAAASSSASAGPASPRGASPAPAPPAPAPAATAAAAGPDLASRSQDALAQSRRLVSAGKADEANRLLTRALQADPGNRELRLALLEAATLARSYQLAAVQLPMIAPLQDEDSASMFYAAVVLYETGKLDEARVYLQRALPRVSGQLVDEYSRKILGRP